VDAASLSRTVGTPETPVYLAERKPSSPIMHINEQSNYKSSQDIINNAKLFNMFIEPKLHILLEPQKILWPQLKDIPPQYVLYGGTAIALRYGHRSSVDFDFFSTDRSDIDGLTKDLPFITNNFPSKIFLDLHGGLNRHFYNHKHIDYFLEPLREVKIYDPNFPEETIVKITFANDENLIAGAINSPDITLDNSIKIASPIDLLAGKILAMNQRSTKRDFIDLGEMIKNGINLQNGFEAAYAISKLSPKGRDRIRYEHLKEDFKAKTIHAILPNNLEYAEIIREEAAKLDIDKVKKTKLKAKIDNFI
jgi:predicted nucleotidyltransferase component of viral defense system